MRTLLRVASWPSVFMIVAALAATFWVSPTAALAILTLASLEILTAADSAVSMAGIAGRLSPVARKYFLSVGLVLGVVIMRLMLPPVAVSIGLQKSLASVASMALHHPVLLDYKVDITRPALAAFGGAFIWLIFSEYLFNVNGETRTSWLGRGEARLARVKHPRAWGLATAFTFSGVAIYATPAPSQPIAVTGCALGISAYLILKQIQRLSRNAGGWRTWVLASTVIFERGLVVFLLFEIVDGSYALTPQPSGLGAPLQLGIAFAGVTIGALFLNRLTKYVHLHGALDRLQYLKAGAAYILGVLAVLLWASLAIPIPSKVAAWIGSAIIGAALIASLFSRRIRPRRQLLRRRKEATLASQPRESEVTGPS